MEPKATIVFHYNDGSCSTIEVGEQSAKNVQAVMMALGKEISASGPTREILYADGQPCEHPACLQHLRSQCEGCGRIGGKGIVYKNQTPSM